MSPDRLTHTSPARSSVLRTVPPLIRRHGRRQQTTTTITKGHVMSNRIRNAGRRVGRAIRTAGRRYVEMMAKCDPNGYGYYVW
jgi:hypothetical protein